MSRSTPRIHALTLAAALVSFLACSSKSEPTKPGDDDDDDPPPADTRPASANANGWEQGQTAPTGSVMTPAIVVKNRGGDPVEDVKVSFTVASGGGSVSHGTVETGSNGVASVQWALGTAVGENTLTAKVEGLRDEITFTVTSRLPKWTYMVYLAADNNLAAAGVGDLDEMEAAGVLPDVRVVVQAEFSKEWLAKAGCKVDDPDGCINRPNWNTFRYVVGGQGARTDGPNGPAQDLGDLDMTKPEVLRDFVAWAKQNHPAENYALVLWNHGGGFTGLIEDATTAGSRFMKVTDLRTALSGDTKVDVLDFDMCLMGGYETLTVLGGAADYVVFSEEVVPGRGNPYKRILDAWKGAPTMPGRDVAAMFVTEFAADFQNDRSSTTRSAYDMAGFAAFEASLDALAGTLRSNVGALKPAISDAAKGAQAYEYSQLKDLVNLLDSLDVRATDATLRTQIASVKAQATSSFRIASKAQSGKDANATNVDRSSGLHVVLPSGTGDDTFSASGPASFTAYAELYPGAAWTQFLAAYLGVEGGSGTTPDSTTATIDQGEDRRLEVYLAWPEEAITKGVDVDLMILEPNGNLYVPFIGTVTPNGHLTNDSADDSTSYEGYLTNRYIQPGAYIFLASLYADPQGYEPAFGLFYRQGQSVEFNDYWKEDHPGEPYPQLSKDAPFSADPDPTDQELVDGKYSDLKIAGGFNLGPAAVASRSGRHSAVVRPHVARLNDAPRARRTPTAAQLRTARRMLAKWHAEGGKERALRLRQPSPAASVKIGTMGTMGTAGTLRRSFPVGGR